MDWIDINDEGPELTSPEAVANVRPKNELMFVAILAFAKAGQLAIIFMIVVHCITMLAVAALMLYFIL
jgi:hypothetical protein